MLATTAASHLTSCVTRLDPQSFVFVQTWTSREVHDAAFAPLIFATRHYGKGPSGARGGSRADVLRSRLLTRVAPVSVWQAQGREEQHLGTTADENIPAGLEDFGPTGISSEGETERRP